MIIGIFTDTYEPQINGVVTSIKTSIEYLEQNHTIYVFCPNVTPKNSINRNRMAISIRCLSFSKRVPTCTTIQSSTEKYKSIKFRHNSYPYTLYNGKNWIKNWKKN